MNIYLIRRDKPAEYDETVAAVVVAASYGDARAEAEKLPGDQPRGSWDLEHADCTLLGVVRGAVKPGVVLSEFRAG